MDNNSPSHLENIDLWVSLTKLCKQYNLEIRHNCTSYSNFDGQHRYLILKQDATNKTINSKSCILWQETRFSKNYLPSISGERKALNNLLFDIYKIVYQ